MIRNINPPDMQKLWREVLGDVKGGKRIPMVADCSEELYTWDFGKVEEDWEVALAACRENPTEDNWKRLVSEIEDAIDEARYDDYGY